MATGGRGMESDRTPVVTTEFDGDDGRTPSEAVIAALAEAEGTAPTELDPLYDAVDGDALDRLFARERGGASPSAVRFSVDDWNVVVRDDGTVVIFDSPTDPEAAASSAKRPSSNRSALSARRQER